MNKMEFYHLPTNMDFKKLQSNYRKSEAKL